MEVLVCDDDADMRAWLAHLLRRVSATVTQATSGRELLDALAERQFDLIITDVRMPAPSGLQVVSMVRTAGLDTPILIITGFPERGIEDSAAHMPQVTVLAKPFTGEELLHALRELVASGC